MYLICKRLQDLNTSYVKVQYAILEIDGQKVFYLNTSYVKVQ